MVKLVNSCPVGPDGHHWQTVKRTGGMAAECTKCHQRLG